MVKSDLAQRNRLVGKLDRIVTAYRAEQAKFRARIRAVKREPNKAARARLFAKLNADLVEYHVDQRVFERNVNRAVRAFGTKASQGGGSNSTAAAREILAGG